MRSALNVALISRPISVALGLLLLALIAIVIASTPAQAQAVSVTDDRGHVVHLAQPPKRIVSLLPSLTESVCALGRCAQLVGVDRYSNYPQSVAQLPQLGGGLDPNLEAIVALRPDVVLVAGASRVAERLLALGLPVMALEPRNYADVQRILTQLGQLLAVDTAPAVWRAIDAGVSAAAQSLPPAVRQTRVYFEVNSGPYGAGESSFIGETLTRLGVKNILPAAMGPFPKLNPETVVRANPDVIMVAQSSAESLPQRPGWQRIRAVAEQRICAFDAEQSNIVVRPGPRLAEGARIMAACLRAKAPGSQTP